MTSEAITILSARLPVLAGRWRSGELDGAEFAARYFLFWQIAVHGRGFASRRHQHDPRPEAGAWLTSLDTGAGERPGEWRPHLIDWLERYHFRGIAESVPIALAAWLRDAWPLEARDDVPAALDVLRMQAAGRRPVTIITDWPRAREPVLGKPDAFAFFLHDLEHAWKFCHSPELHAGQREFFARLAIAIDLGVFATCLREPRFVTRFHYLASDMNTHPEHSRQYLRAILIECYAGREPRGPDDRLSDFSEREIEALLAAVDGVSRPPTIAIP